MDGQFAPGQDIQMVHRGTQAPPSSASPSKSFAALYSDPASFTTYTFSGVNFQTDSERSLVVVAIGGRFGASDRQVSSVTIGGVAATQVASAGLGAATAAMYQAAPSGTSGDVVVTFSAGASGAGIAVWSLYNLASTTKKTSVANTAATQTVRTLSLNTAIGDIVLAYTANQDAGTPTHTWVGVTEEASGDAAFDGTNTHSAGSHVATSAETPRTITATASQSCSVMAGVSAAWA